MKKNGAMPLEAWAFPLIVAAICLAGFLFRSEIGDIFRNRQEIRQWLDARGILGPLAFIGLQVIQVIVFVIPGELTQATGGFVFGFWLGTALSLAGIGLGSLVNYGIGRLFGRPFVLAVLGSERLMRAERLLADRKAEMGYLILFLVPGIPKDVLCYMAGMAKAPPLVFLAASMIARLPGIAGSALIGTAAYSGKVALAFWLLAFSSLALIAGLVWRKPLEALFQNISFRKRDS